ncbi:ABC transporter permease [Actinocorallia lasiicapitis]
MSKISVLDTRRLLALGRTEMLLLFRNRSALGTALILPAASMAFLNSIEPEPVEGTEGLPGAIAAQVLTGTLGIILLVVIYSTLVGAYVARREGMILKRLRSGELRDGEILIGTALPALAVAAFQCLVLSVVGISVLNVPPPDNPFIIAAALIFGMFIVSALAACSSALTSTVEMAQLTVLPLILLSLGGAGLVVPLSTMPESLAEICHFLPLTPVIETVRIGWIDTEDVGSANIYQQLAMAALWVIVSAWGATRWFRWEPRN